MAAEARYAPLNAEAPPQPASRRRCCSATALARAGACLGVAVLALGLGVVVQLQVDLARMTILSREQLALEVGPNATARHVAADARAKASFAYSWLVHRSPRGLVPWESLADGDRPWMNASSPLYARGHCDGARLADLVEGDDDDARCGPWSRRRRGCAGGYYEDPADASADGAPLACPPGMFCPEGFTCFVACLYGAACAPSTYDADADACAWAVTLKHTPSSRGYRGGANVTCPGVMFETLVPAGFYAPDPTVDPRRCPAQHYCPTGSFEPTRCPFVARCGEEGLEAPDVSSAAAAAFLGSVFFFMLYHSSRLVRA